MIFIIPWASYKSEDIPNLNPQNNEEVKGCIGGMIAFCISSLIFIMLMYATVKLTINKIIDGDIMMICIIVNASIFVALTIILMKLSFKIVDKLATKKKKK